MTRFVIVLFSLLLMPLLSSAQMGEDLRISGYMQGNPVYLSATLPQPVGDVEWMEYRLQNRLNLRWDATSDLTFHAQMRTRFFGGDLVREIPGYASMIDRDDGFVDLSWLITEQSDWFLHYLPDRLYTDWNIGEWNVRLGRQRVNWGINMVTNPNDIFNIYSFYDFDYPERPGADALRIQRYLGFGSRVEVAISPDRDIENSVAAGLYSFHAGGYDFQVISGYYREKVTAGGGWAGNIRGAGFKGETMFYADAAGNGDRETNFIAAVSGDYMFSNGLFAVGEVLYNHEGGREQFELMTEELRPDNPSFSRYQLTTYGSYPVHTLVDASLAAMYYPDEAAVFISPSVTWSAMQDLDIQLLSQLFIGSDDSAFANAGNLVTLSVKYNY